MTKKVITLSILIPTSLFFSYIFLFCSLSKVKTLKECLDDIDRVVK